MGRNVWSGARHISWAKISEKEEINSRLRNVQKSARLTERARSEEKKESAKEKEEKRERWGIPAEEEAQGSPLDPGTIEKLNWEGNKKLLFLWRWGKPWERKTAVQKKSGGGSQGAQKGMNKRERSLCR